jgi:hypothetical protein
MWDKRKNKKLQKAFQEIEDSLLVDKVHGTYDDFRRDMFPSEYEGQVLVRVNPIRRN